MRRPEQARPLVGRSAVCTPRFSPAASGAWTVPTRAWSTDWPTEGRPVTTLDKAFHLRHEARTRLIEFALAPPLYRVYDADAASGQHLPGWLVGRRAVHNGRHFPFKQRSE